MECEWSSDMKRQANTITFICCTNLIPPKTKEPSGLALIHPRKKENTNAQIRLYSIKENQRITPNYEIGKIGGEILKFRDFWKWDTMVL